MNEIRIVPTEHSHLDAICSIEKLCFSSPWSKNSFVFGIDNPNTQSYYTALMGEKVVGYICTFHLFDEGELLNIATAPDMRKMGIAQMLINKMEETMKERGVKRITLEVRESNVPAYNLYTKNGFTSIAIRKNYYSLPTENGIVMEKHI